MQIKLAFEIRVVTGHGPAAGDVQQRTGVEGERIERGPPPGGDRSGEKLIVHGSEHPGLNKGIFRPVARSVPAQVHDEGLVVVREEKTGG